MRRPCDRSNRAWSATESSRIGSDSWRDSSASAAWYPASGFSPRIRRILRSASCMSDTGAWPARKSCGRPPPARGPWPPTQMRLPFLSSSKRPPPPPWAARAALWFLRGLRIKAGTAILHTPLCVRRNTTRWGCVPSRSLRCHYRYWKPLIHERIGRKRLCHSIPNRDHPCAVSLVEAGAAHSFGHMDAVGP